MLFLKQISKNETNSGVMRLIVGGGRAAENADARGAVIVGVRTLSEGGRVGDFTREQVTSTKCYSLLFPIHSFSFLYVHLSCMDVGISQNIYIKNLIVLLMLMFYPVFRVC